jgi:cytochrome c5
LRFGFAELSAVCILAAVVVLGIDKAKREARYAAVPPASRAAAAVSPASRPASLAAAADSPVETPDVLPEGHGRDETFYYCTACHGAAIIKQQGMTRDQWDQSFDWMVDRHKMPVPDPQLRALLLDYLAASFPQRQRRGRPNPFLNQ